MPTTSYIKEIKDLVKEYGIEKIAELLGVTVRGVQYWIDENNPKAPRRDTVRKIHELFERYRNSEEIFEVKEEQENGLRDDLIQLLKEKNSRLQKEVELNLKELDRQTKVIAGVQAAMMEMILVLCQEKRGVYNKCVEILKKHKLEGSFL